MCLRLEVREEAIRQGKSLSLLVMDKGRDERNRIVLRGEFRRSGKWTEGQGLVTPSR